jgi:hypothetical protein
MLSRDERRHAAQRRFLLQTSTQRTLEALVLGLELRGIVHHVIVPRRWRELSPRALR